jgi:DNA (cytosine-5)-methyltransferase 1
VPRYGDVRNVGGHNLESVELIVGGFPCQPHSVAGKRRGKEDDRNLWPELLRVVKEIRPAWVLAENVPGIVSLYLDTVLSDLEGEDYTCWTFNIPACAFDAPHLRKRIFVVAHTNGGGRGHGETTHKAGNNPVWRAQEQAGGCGCDVAHAKSEQRSQPEARDRRTMLTRGSTEIKWGEYWVSEPDVGRVAHGIPNRVDRLRALGNAVVPQIAEYIGKCILAVL